ncbi:MAG TPA: hypothetical protein VLY24_10165 [Bryobacteraceae bacterium]|nr:hypothetical protein [Bryobacteraceae bacterium]
MIEALRTAHLWLPGWCGWRIQTRGLEPPKRIWLMIADHFEPWWRDPDDQKALERVERWTGLWPAIARRHCDSAGRPPCYTFFYPAEQYHPRVIDDLTKLCREKIGDVEIHLHHDRDTEDQFCNRMGLFIDRLHSGHGLLHKENGRPVFGFIHGNWALDNSLPGGRLCGLNNEIALLRDLGCYADFTLPSAPSPAQVRMVNTIYWATDDVSRPKSHDWGIPLQPGGPVCGDLLMIPGPLTVNLREWNRHPVPKLETGELAGHALPSRHRARLWIKAAPRIGSEVFIKLFTHGAPEKNSVPLLEGGALDRTLNYVTEEAKRIGAHLLFVSAWQMWKAIDAVRSKSDPLDAVGIGERAGAMRI